MREIAPSSDAVPDYYRGGFEHVGPESAAPARPAPPLLALFLGTLVAGCIAAAAFAFLRPAQYQATASLLVIPDLKAAQPAVESVRARQLAVEQRTLMSRPVLQRVYDRVTADERWSVEAPMDLDALAQMLDSELDAETGIVKLYARGARPRVLPAVLDAWIDVLLARHADRQAASSDRSNSELADRVAALGARVADKRRELERYRLDNDIVSAERGESQVLRRLDGLTTSLAKAEEEQTAARAELETLREADARGEPVIGAADQAALTRLEAEVKALRKQVADYEERYTTQYMMLDRNIVLEQRRLESLEQELAQAREASRRRAFAEAEDRLARAERASASLSRQLAEQKRLVRDFTARFAAYEALERELAQLEEQHRDAQKALVAAEVEAGAGFPEVQVLERAFVPTRPIGREPMRELALGSAAALLLALLVVAVAELQRRGARPMVRAGAPHEGAPAAPALGRVEPVFQVGQAPAMPALSHDSPRELVASEVAALVAAADAPGEALLRLLASGVTAGEAAALCWGQVDWEGGALEISGPTPRRVPLSPGLRAALSALGGAGEGADRPLFHDQDGEALPEADLEAWVACYAHDAGLRAPAELNSHHIRHAYVLHLVRQGLRLSELPGLVGPMAPTTLAAYGAYSPQGPGVAASEVDPVHPVNRMGPARTA